MKKIVLGSLLVLILILGGVGFYFHKQYKYYSKPKDDDRSQIVYIKTGTDWNGLIENLKAKGVLEDGAVFEWVADYKKFKTIKPGKYRLVKYNQEGSISELLRCNAIVNTLKSGNQLPVKVTFNNVRTQKELARKITANLELDSTEFYILLQNEAIVRSYGFNSKTITCMFMPDSYEFYWTVSAQELLDKMNQYYKEFWNEERLKKAKDLNMKPTEISIIASIVEKETNYEPEKSAIAGVYINRYKSGWMLQADPTVVFAVGDFSLRRVLDKHTSFDSPYNTYKYYGLPPGPICIPSKKTIDATLNREKHQYYYFCAKPDRSGSHAFAKTWDEHIENAQKYWKSL